MIVIKMRLLRWMCGQTRREGNINKNTCKLVGVASIEDKLRDNILRWFDHIQRQVVVAKVKKRDKIFNI